ncbi:hypothetical protein C2G16_09280, partial [Neisseria gonorrhoeae]
MPSETVGSIVNVGVDESVGFSPPFPSIQHFYRFHRIHRIRLFRPPGPMQLNRHSHGSGNLGRGVWATVLSDKFPCGQVRIPACAGMTGFEIAVLSDGFRDCGVVGRVSRLRCCRTGFEIAVLSDGFRDCGVVGRVSRLR